MMAAFALRTAWWWDWTQEGKGGATPDAAV
jgi:hypothetical protein